MVDKSAFEEKGRLLLEKAAPFKNGLKTINPKLYGVGNWRRFDNSMWRKDRRCCSCCGGLSFYISGFADPPQRLPKPKLA